ncbi:MAG: hypothetical protein HY958_04195 [Bacteroidia bacterium]|nr:hypothetical protein [Bacteroidia bacterium]
MKKAPVLLVSILFIISAFAQVQNRANDNLVKELGAAGHDTTKIILLSKLSDNLRSSDPVKAMEYAAQGIAFAEKINFRKGLSPF